MKLDKKLINDIEQYVSDYLTTNLPAHCHYHNLDHTRQVVANTTLLCKAMNVERQDRHALITAAWFHDLGYTRQCDQHEVYSCQVAAKFLRSHGLDKATIAFIESLIKATRYPQEPKNKLEKILCDADMLGLADENFMITADQLRQEWREGREKNYSDEAWYKLNLDFLSRHVFHTRYAQEKFNKGKERNQARLAERLRMLQTEGESSGDQLKVKKFKYVKGVETLFRNSSRNHMELSAMADNKAHILLSISSLIISVFISFVFQQLITAHYLIFPTALIMLVCLVTIVLAVMTTRPKISQGVFTVEDVEKRKANLLFFGNFHSMDMHMFEWGIREMSADRNYLYTSMTRDIYYLGKVLGVKYRYLSLGYTVFMYGMVLAVLSFPISYLLLR